MSMSMLTDGKRQHLVPRSQQADTACTGMNTRYKMVSTKRCRIGASEYNTPGLHTIAESIGAESRKNKTGYVT